MAPEIRFYSKYWFSHYLLFVEVLCMPKQGKNRKGDAIWNRLLTQLRLNVTDIEFSICVNGKKELPY